MTLIYPDSFDSICKSEECSGQMRWLNVVGYDRPTLQQQWKVTTYKDGKPWSLDFEWRDVPYTDGSD